MTGPRGGRHAESVLVVGTLLSIAIGVMFYVRTDVAVALATVAGFQGVVITLQLETLIRERRKVEILTRQAQLMTKLEKIDWLVPVVDDIARASSAITEQFGGTMALQVLRRLLDKCVSDLQELEKGRMRHGWEDVDLGYRQINQASRSVRATSIQATDLSWWSTPPGRRYWDAHLRAISRGVHIERIFIYETMTDELKDLMNEQADGEVHVLALDIKLVPRSDRKDFVIWDDTAACETLLGPDAVGIENLMTLSPREIDNYITLFNSIFVRADEWRSSRTTRCPLH